ncbi:MAG: glycosyltransferase family 2 protein [Acidobacteria bacterium]|nr:glycosyltransferase family 2 protein [Acidobacteriota bacterium]
MPTVSVIIPCYNGAHHVAIAIDSVLSQTMHDLEVIVVDDGSTDDTARVVELYRSDLRVRCLYQKNRGLPGARNAGALASRAEFLAFLDADDRLAPQALEVMLDHLNETHAAWCLIDIIRRTPEGAELQKTVLPEGDIVHGILRDDFIRRAMFFDREAFCSVGMYDEDMKNREDWDINIRMIASGMAFAYVPQALYFYTWRPQSITVNRAKMLRYTEILLRKHHKPLADGGDREVRRIYADLLWGLARQHLYQTSDWRSALRCAFQSLQNHFSVARLFHPLIHQGRRLASK